MNYTSKQLQAVFGTTNVPEMTGPQAQLVSGIGSKLSGILGELEGKIAPEFFDSVARAAITLQSTVYTGVHAGWNSNKY